MVMRFLYSICALFLGVAMLLSCRDNSASGNQGDQLALQIEANDKAIMAASKSEWSKVAGRVVKSKYLKTSPIINAIYLGNEEAAIYFLENGYPIDEFSNIDGSSPLLLASYECSEALCLRLLASTPKRHINFVSMRGRTVLHNAAARGFRKLGIELLSRGADPNAREIDGTTPLMRLAGSRVPDIALCDNLLKAGALRQLKNNRGRTAYDISVYDKQNSTLLKRLEVDTNDLQRWQRP